MPNASKHTEEDITTFEIDLDNPPPLTAEQQAELDALAARPDAGIDYSDISPLGDTALSAMERKPH